MTSAGTGEPRSGTELLERMHDAFAGRWFRTLTFVQKTTQRDAKGAAVVTTWYEALQAPDRLRIDFRPAFVVGSSGPADVTSPQFWVDEERLVLVRMLLPLIPTGKSAVQDIILDDYVQAGGGWLATKILMLDGGQLLQQEEYSDWRTGMSLSPQLFQAEHWKEAPHWRATVRGN